MNRVEWILNADVLVSR